MAHVSNQTDFPLAIIPLVDPQTGQLTDIWWQFLWILWQRTGQSMGDSTLSSGMMMVWPGADTALPTGWLLCDGSAISREGYPLLFSAIGTTWGAGDGSTTFNLPDFRGRNALGVSASHVLGATGGAESVTLNVTNLPAHSHGVTDPGHQHQAPDDGGAARNFVVDGAGTVYSTAAGAKAGYSDILLTRNTKSATTGITTQDTGSGVAVSTLSPYAAVHWMIKT